MLKNVIIQPDDWERLTGEKVYSPVKVLALPQPLTEQEKDFLRIGKSVSQLQSLAPNGTVLIDFNNKESEISTTVNGVTFQLCDMDVEDGNIADILERLAEEISLL